MRNEEIERQILIHLHISVCIHRGRDSERQKGNKRSRKREKYMGTTDPGYNGNRKQKE